MLSNHAGVANRVSAAAKPIALSVFLLVLLAVRLVALLFAETELFVDEAQYWSWSRELAFGYFSKPPLIAWIIRASTSVCGDTEACIRASAPIFYTLSSGLIYLCARALYNTRVAVVSALALATAPGASFSSGQISTDVPLLLFWSLALFAWIKLIEAQTWRWAALLGVALGLGLLAKYAMLYFLFGIAVHALASSWARARIRPGLLVIAGVAALLIVAPHLLWSIRNEFVTLAHTVDNASWGGSLFHPDEFMEFVGSQFGVFGPILFGAFLVIAWRVARPGTSEAERFLLSFSLPILILVSIQAFLSRANANWAAVAYPAATILVSAVLVEANWRRTLRLSMAIHLAFAAAFPVALAFASQVKLPGNLDAFSRQLGWREVASIVRAETGQFPYEAILTQNRWVSAELLYYLRDVPLPLMQWREPGPPRDHFELTRPFRPVAGPVLLVSTRNGAVELAQLFRSSAQVASDTVAAGPTETRRVQLFRVQDYIGPE